MPTSDKYATVFIDDGLNTVPIRAMAGESLLHVLRRSGKPISAPCGGKGTCKKCNVEIDDAVVYACQYRIDKDIHVKLVGSHQFTILEKSHPNKIVKNDSGLDIRIEHDVKRVAYKEQNIITELDQSTAHYGLAIDIGSTTIVIFLEDFESYNVLDVTSFINPQTAYGGDVISRITYCMENERGLSVLQKRVIEGLNTAIITLCERNGIHPNSIYKTTIAGNTVMLHFICGIDPRSIAFAPYSPVFVETKQLKAHELNVQMHPNGIVIILPSVAGYVGADIVAGVATTDLMDRNGFTLYIDIGTNGEIALGNRDKIYCCATAAGPAFEGANIECGVGGVNGAISAYEDETYTTIGSIAPIGLCGSGLIDIVATLLDKGIIDTMGYMDENFLVAPKKECGIDRDIILSPNDVRQVQLAKAAIFAGMTTLLKVAGIGFSDINKLFLAGGFGNYIRIESGIRIGLLPDGLKDRIISIGNAAGTGARFALKSVEFEKDIARVIKSAEYIELSMRKDFNEAYVAAMMFE